MTNHIPLPSKNHADSQLLGLAKHFGSHPLYDGFVMDRIRDIIRRGEDFSEAYTASEEDRRISEKSDLLERELTELEIEDIVR
ncbi:hypothetical protein [Enterovibrio calviensis]|uniref:hypothetical protein n=1 Tax=Enterovibrio calviensis TaxID=91359 RepID=UPI000483E40B|nr:hypothetical protein [Enterovibrio calviensis]